MSPASCPDPTEVERLVTLIEGWGLSCDVAPHALDRFGYMAGTDEDRLADLNEAFRDPAVRAVVTTRGGAGAYRIADAVDFAAVRTDPKPVLGFSDISYLHLALAKYCRLAVIHGCLVGQSAERTARHLLMTTDPITLESDPRAVSAAVAASGRVVGRVLGGNLTAVATSIGIRVPDLSGAILFLEDQRVVGTVDRQLTQLIASGVLDGVAGVALGSFEGFRDYYARGWTIVEVLLDRLGGLGVPVLGGLSAGHDVKTPSGEWDQSAVPLGTTATLDVAAGTLTVAPAVN